MESRKRVVLEAAILNFPSIGAGATEELTIASQDAAAGGIVTLGQPAGFPDGLIATGYIDGSDQIVVRVHNPTGAAIDPSAGTAIAAQGTLTMDTQPTDLDTVVIGGVTYTFLDSFVDTVDNVWTGVDLAASQVNLTAAINASGGTPGTTHFTSQVVNPTVTNATFATDDSVFTATVAGRAGNEIVTDDSDFTTGTNVFDDTTLGATTQGADAAEAAWKVGLIL